MDPLPLFLKRLEMGKVNSMIIALRQLQCAGHPRAAVEMPHPPTYQACLAAPQVAFLAGPGIKKSPQEQEVPFCSPFASRWKVELLLMEMVLTDLRVQGCFPRSRQECVLATPRNPLGTRSLFHKVLALLLLEALAHTIWLMW